MKSTLFVLIFAVAAISAFQFDENQLARVRRALISAHARARRQVQSTRTPSSVKAPAAEEPTESLSEPESEEILSEPNAEYNVVGDNSVYNYDPSDYYSFGIDVVDPFEEAITNSFRQYYLAYPDAEQHLDCTHKCKQYLKKINTFDSGEKGDHDPFDLQIFKNETDDKNADFVINISGDLPAFWDLLGNGKDKFNEDRFNNMCGVYKEGVDCVNKCPYGFFTRLVNGIFRPIEYMCVVARDDYVKYATCGYAADLKPCKEKCTKPDKNETHSLESGMDKVSDICAYVACQTDCAAPEIIKACDGDKKAETIFEGVVDQIVGAIVDLTTLLGFAPGPVGDCVDIMANATSLPSEKKLPPPLDVFVLPQPELSVHSELEAIQIKLFALQIVKTEKELLNLDLQNEHLTMKIKQQLACPDKACSSAFT